jgi:hypothetical protein
VIRGRRYRLQAEIASSGVSNCKRECRREGAKEQKVLNLYWGAVSVCSSQFGCLHLSRSKTRAIHDIELVLGRILDLIAFDSPHESGPQEDTKNVLKCRLFFFDHNLTLTAWKSLIGGHS